jgi:hypothetical protein
MSFIKPATAICLQQPVTHRPNGLHSIAGSRTSSCTSILYQSLLFIIIYLLTCFSANAQSKWVFEHYNYIQQAENTVFVPMLHFQTKNNWYIEFRYNYEDAQTASLFGGKTINGGGEFEYSITPMAGFSAGLFTGVSLAATTEAEWKRFYVWAQTQYSIGTKKSVPDFFFNWSELGYNISDRFFGGLAMQFTRQEGQNIFEPGFVAGFNYKNLSFPVYVLSPFQQGRYYVIGLNYEYTLKKKTKK